MKKRNMFRHGFIYLIVMISVIVLVTTLLKPAPEGGELPPPDRAADTNPWDAGFGWVFCGPLILIVVGVMFRTYRQQQKLMKHVEQVRFNEMPNQRSDIPEASKPIVDALLERGFTRIDDLIYITPDDMTASGIPTYLGNSSQVMAIVAVLSHLPKPNLTLETLYANGAVLHTYYPYGVPTRSARHEASRQRRGPGEAVDYHLRRMQEFGEKHGAIYASATPADRVAWFTAFGARPASAFDAWLQQMGWLIPVLLLVIVMALAVNTSLFGDILRAYFLYGSCLLLIGWLVYNVIIGRIILRR